MRRQELGGFFGHFLHLITSFSLLEVEKDSINLRENFS